VAGIIGDAVFLRIINPKRRSGDRIVRSPLGDKSGVSTAFRETLFEEAILAMLFARKIRFAVL
jgi:hypothetical protein